MKRRRRKGHESVHFEDVDLKEGMLGREKEPAQLLEEEESEKVAQEAIGSLRKEYI